MRVKKILVIVMVLMIAMGTLVGCGSKNSSLSAEQEDAINTVKACLATLDESEEELQDFRVKLEKWKVDNSSHDGESEDYEAVNSLDELIIEYDDGLSYLGKFDTNLAKCGREFSLEYAALIDYVNEDQEMLLRETLKCVEELDVYRDSIVYYTSSSGVLDTVEEALNTIEKYRKNVKSYAKKSLKDADISGQEIKKVLN